MVATSKPRTLYEKVFDDHVVTDDNGNNIMFIDRHLVHEVTSPQAFEGLRNAGRKVRRPDCTLATVDHNIPTSKRENFKSISTFIEEQDSRTQCATLEENIKEFGLTYFGMDDSRQGIVHIIGPEQGFTLPGTTVVCGDSHTSTHGAFGALAFGIGTSEVEHVLATQTLQSRKSKNMKVCVDGPLGEGVTSKDLVLHVIGIIGTAGGTGCVIEFCGSTIRSLSMEARMSICNMAIEGGARAGMIAPDQITYDYLKSRPLAPKGEEWDKAIKYWSTLQSDPEASYDIEVNIEAKDIPPTVSWGTSPQDVVSITGNVPSPESFPEGPKRQGCERALEYMGLKAGAKMSEIPIDKVFIGSCTNSRIEDLRAVAAVARGRKVASNVKLAMIVPGSGNVKRQAEAEGIDRVLTAAGFDWREAGCSMCLGMNPDQLSPQERCASTSNRNFEGRQGAGGRTHLCSPAMAAAAAITGRLTDVRELAPALPSSTSDSEPALKILDPKDYTTNQSTLKLSEAKPQGPPETDGAPSAVQQATRAAAAAGMTKFTVVKGLAAALDLPNIDTDMIIPKQFLKTIKRTGLGSAAFYGMRYDPQTGKPDPNFVLNQEPWTKASILINVGGNFGCGSSREHAPWALLDQGIRCIISTSFADIFFNNTFKNGMLPVVLPQEDVVKLSQDAKESKEVEVDLENKVVKRYNGESIPFNVDDFRRHCLLNGLDDIGLTLQKEDDIVTFEKRRSETWPWLDGQEYAGRTFNPPKSKSQKMDW
ncbi:putative 3-isopropylmalate dehydratase [Wallemia mellicola]|uniref:3-isopropylmalate dehydratase n=2 Tax=Wallemia mellicola TaxID=1708541 RepID=A0A4T0NA88_9BASI|nr:putative 3-isopropylmalate dehydratase [Wallemia mellicola CBS 633.66]TIB71380.1 hypothetical protein E3Q24_02327 [Wallemia mellicola]EIM22655.1 putative 3-isopropylmalate dehydratase [Wallemia mellicola CBS 633.66]TIB76108.1 hypothetical protein E3Q23_02006 [Wallemia mellicola]TIB79665.1 putative 3-isopropylmalate dehydratase [Wallemia mellicola]TIB83820.1 putative 3-isopropylmalate dehydratase [Wallemia mellicola]|eukprot:XP_006957320.1 putative 3-isopropylmalate dehydratase [Wallemia mellicola CBS 633.66]